MRCFLAFLLFNFPIVASAAVSISEVAWMGSTESANHEWIELHNDGEAIDVSGWNLSDGMNLNIELTGVIPAGSFVVLERTSDNSAQGSAWLIYTGALVNSGATLKLKRADDTLVDQVSGGEDWQNIGGDNITKETAQYTTAGWVTAPATPGEELDPSVVVETDDDTQTEQETSSSKVTKPKSKSGTGEAVRLILPDQTLRLEVDAQKLGYVNQVIDFSVEPSGIGKTLIDSLQYEWNFGDGATSSRKETSHIYQYPGTYVVAVYAGFKRQEQVERHEITILPVSFSLTTNKKGDVQINNDSPYEIDISGYKLSSDSSFVLPPRTILLPNQTITIPKHKLGETEDRMLALYDATFDLVASKLPTSLENKTQESVVAMTDSHGPAPLISSVNDSRNYEVVETDFVFAAASEEVQKEEELVIEENAGNLSPQLAAANTATQNKNVNWPYLGLAGALAVGIFGVLAAPRRNREE